MSYGIGQKIGRRAKSADKSIAANVIPELDYPDVSAGGRGFENISEFRPKVMAGLDHKR
jgi:hypothetical protein